MSSKENTNSSPKKELGVGIKFIRRNSHIAYSLILIIFIPIAIIINTLLFVDIFKNNTDQVLYDKVIAIGNTVNVALIDAINNPNELKEKLEIIKSKNINIASLEIKEKKDDDFKIIASFDNSLIGELTSDTASAVSWRENQPVALLTKNSISGERFWSITMPFKDKSGGKKALLVMKLSLAQIDAITKKALIRSYIILTFTILIIVLLLANNARLFEYATLYRKLKEVDQMKDEFISIASHELRTPVTGIRGYISMVLDGSFGPVSDKLKNGMKMAESASNRLANLVEDLLNVSRIEQDRFKISAKPTDVNDIIFSITEELRVQSNEKGLGLEYKPRINPFPLINIDTERFKQVLINIIGNAIKYTKKGGIEILTQTSGDQKFLEIRVKDTGVGMSAEERERLFEKFYRVKNEETVEIVGTGLGLWITGQIVKIMKGKIMIDSMKGVGTQVTIVFPIISKGKR